MTRTLSDIWVEFRTELESHNQRLVSEYEAAWSELHALLESAKPVWEQIIFWRQSHGQLSALQALFGSSAEQLLGEPLAAWQQARIQERVLDAIADHRKRLEETVARLPTALSISGQEMAETFGADGHGAWWRRVWLRWRRKPRSVPLQALVRQHLRQQSLKRGKLEGAFLLLLAQACPELSTPWHTLRREALRRLLGAAPDSRPMRRGGKGWQRRLTKNSHRATALLGRFNTWRDAASPRLAAALLRGGQPAADEQRQAEAAQLENYFSYWSRQCRAVTALLKLNLNLVEWPGRHRRAPHRVWSLWRRSARAWWPNWMRLFAGWKRGSAKTGKHPFRAGKPGWFRLKNV
jgi:hypothetical protein